jgi:hypothetical protein
MSWLQEKTGCVVLRVKALPGSRRNQVRGLDAGVLKVAVTAPPEKSKANKALVETLAQFLRVPRRNVAIVSGETSRAKRVEILGITAAEVEDKLTQLES